MESENNFDFNQRSKKSSNNGLGWKIATAAFGLLFLGSLGFIYNLQNEKVTCNQEVVKISTEKEQLQNELKAKIAEYDLAIGENTSMKTELEEEKQKIVSLLSKLEKSENSLANVRTYKKEYLSIKKEMDDMLKKNEELVVQNQLLTKELDSTKVVATNIKKVIDTLSVKNNELATTVKKAKKLTISNVNAVAYKKKSSGKLVETEKAKKANTIKILFTIAENQIADKGERKYYTQIIDPNNNVIGEKKTETFGEKHLDYSYLNSVSYENATQSIEQEIPVEQVTSGNYSINIFDETGNLVGNTLFALK